VICGGVVTLITFSGSSSGSESLARTAIVTAVSSGVVTESFAAFGGSLTQVTAAVEEKPSALS
jgi:hypothetical protein